MQVTTAVITPGSDDAKGNLSAVRWEWLARRIAPAGPRGSKVAVAVCRHIMSLGANRAVKHGFRVFLDFVGSGFCGLECHLAEVLTGVLTDADAGPDIVEALTTFAQELPTTYVQSKRLPTDPPTVNQTVAFITTRVVVHPFRHATEKLTPRFSVHHR